MDDQAEYSAHDIQKREQTPMRVELDRLGEALERLENQASVLNARLGVVLQPKDGPSQPGGDRPHPVMSDHVASVWSAANRVEEVMRRLATMTDELEV
jgi:hypothetical protein